MDSFSLTLHLPDTLGNAFVRTNRLFYLDAAEAAYPGWYCAVRGGRVFGPFTNREEADKEVEKLVTRYRSLNDAGGR